MPKVRWGLLSTARINRSLIPAIRKSKRGELAAVASRSQAGAQNYAREWDIPLAFGSYHEMLTSGAVDAVYIGLPNHLHAEWTIKALKAGVNVLCEKPFAVSIQEVDAVIAASEESGAVAAEAFMYRHHPQTQVVKGFIQDGGLGEILMIRGGFNFLLGDDGRRPDSLNVRMVPEFGGGCLWDVGIYPLSYSQFLMDGPPAWVFGSQHIGPTGIDEVFSGQLGYELPSGREVIAQISSSFNSPYHTFMEIIGSQGKLGVSRPFNNIEKDGSVVFVGRKDKVEKIRVPKKTLYLGEVEDLEAAILDGAPTLISLEETRGHVLTALALYESARSGQVVRLEDFSRSRQVS